MRIFILICLMVVCSAGQLPVRFYTAAQGLAGDSVNDILQDRRGFLWVATDGGISRFDGFDFGRIPSHGKPGEGYVRALTEDRFGSIWAATATGLIRLDAIGAARERFLPPGGSENEFIFRALEDREGRMWISTRGGLFRFATPGPGNTPAFEAIPTPDSLKHPVLCMIEDRSGGIWMGNQNGVWRHTAGNFEHIVHADVTGSLLEDRRGDIWATTLESGVLRIRDRTALKITTADRLPTNRTYTLLETSGGRLLVGHAVGVVELLGGDGKTHPRVLNLTGGQGFEKTEVRRIFEDRQGNLWVGSEGGLIQIMMRGFVSYTERDGLANNRVQSIFEHGGRLYVITRQVDINIHEKGRFRTVQPNAPAAKDPQTWGWAHAHSVARDSRGDWWIPTRAGLYRFAKPSRVEDLARAAPAAWYRSADGLPGEDVIRVFPDSMGNVWISVVGDNGFVRWRPDRQGFVRQTPGPMERPLPHGLPLAFLEDRWGGIWMGFSDGGAARYSNGSYTYFWPEDGAPAGLVSEIHQDQSGDIWFASAAGLIRLTSPNSAEPAWTKVSESPAECVTEDGFGRIYVCARTHVERWDPPSFSRPSARYSTLDGLPRGTLVHTFRDSGGILWFGAKEGLASWAPREEQSPSFPVSVLGMKAAGRSLEFGRGGAPRLASSDRHVEFQFVTPQFGGSPLRHQHKLEPWATEWSEPAEPRVVEYAGIVPGTYRFSVRSVSNDGTPGPPATVDFVISPPFWRSAWFGAAVVVSAGLTMWLLHRWRVKRAVEMERVRMRIATDLHDELGADLSRLAVLSHTAKFGNHEEAVRRIADLARHMLQSTSDAVWAIRPQGDRLSQLLQRMREFASTLFEGNDVRVSFRLPEIDLRVDPEVRTNVFSIYKECLNNVARHAHATAVQIEVTIEKRLLVLRVSDNGCGLGSEAAGRASGRHGIGGMRWRAQLIGGSLDVRSNPGGGVDVELRAPLRK